MRCRNCDYNLWALKARECPECGHPFVPGEYEFVPGSVRYACPHCEQSYYGMAANGHLVPAEFDCVSCGRHIHMNEMVLFPAEGVREEQTQPECQPWLARAENGRLRSWFQTVGMALVAPQRLMRLTPVESSVGVAWWFALTSQFVYCGVGLVPIILFPLIMLAGMGPGGPGVAGMSGAFVGTFIAFALAIVFVIALWGVVAHGVLHLTGGTAHSIGRTYQAFCYGSGANVLAGVPCFGMHLLVSGLSSIWWMVSTILMLKEGQRVHGGRAALAVLTLPVLLLAGVLVLIVVLSRFSLGPTVVFPTSAPAPSALSGFAQLSKARTMSDALLAYVRHHDSQPPAHALELLGGNYLPDFDALLISDVPNRKKVMQIAGTRFADFEGLSLEEKRRVIGLATAGLPAKPVAHRMGDFVFTYHGISFGSPDPELWLFIVWPDVSTGGEEPGEVFAVGKADGEVDALDASSMAGALREQNALRARYRLPALPHPEEVEGPSTRPE